MEAVLVTVGRDHDMTNKRIRLPKDGAVESDAGRWRRGPPGHRHDDEDVEGHGFVNPAPPADFSKPGPSSGGEFVHNHEDADRRPTDLAF